MKYKKENDFVLPKVKKLNVFQEFGTYRSVIFEVNFYLKLIHHSFSIAINFQKLILIYPAKYNF